MLVEPVPLTVWFKVPPVRVKLLEFVTVPPILSALEVNAPEIFMFWFMAALLITEPEISVEPCPKTVLFKVPSLRVREPPFDTEPPTFVAEIVKSPEILMP